MSHDHDVPAPRGRHHRPEPERRPRGWIAPARGGRVWPPPYRDTEEQAVEEPTVVLPALPMTSASPTELAVPSPLATRRLDRATRTAHALIAEVDELLGRSA